MESGTSTPGSSIHFKSQKSEYEISIKSEDNSASSWNPVFEEAMLALKQNDRNRSHALISKSLDLKTTNCRILDKRTKTYFRIGRLEDSLYTAERMIELDPDNYRGYYMAGRALYRLGNPTALSMYKKAQDLYDESIKISRSIKIQERMISERISMRRQKLERLHSSEDHHTQSKEVKSRYLNNPTDPELAIESTSAQCQKLECLHSSEGHYTQSKRVKSGELINPADPELTVESISHTVEN